LPSQYCCLFASTFISFSQNARVSDDASAQSIWNRWTLTLQLCRLAVDEKAADGAPTSIGIKELVDDNLEIVMLYERMAKRHDKLVDAVKKKLQNQAE